MYEMKGALYGCAARLGRLPAKQFQFRWFPSVTVPARLLSSLAVPARPVSQPRRSSLAGFPASPFRFGRFPSLTIPSSAGFPASPFRFGQFPSFTVSSSAGFPASLFPVWLVSQLHCFQFGWFPASPVRAVRLPVRPGATRRPPVQTPAENTGFPAFPAPRGSPGMVPVPCGECISTPSASVAQEPTGIHFEFFPRPHVVHRIQPVIRTSRRLSTGFCTTHPQVTRRNSEIPAPDRPM